MPYFTTTKRIMHRAEEMFALVADVEKYPEFLPMCEALSVRSRQEYKDKTLLVADMTVGYKFIRETFTSQILLKSDEKIIEVDYLNGPFRYLHNHWTFQSLEDAPFCKVGFVVDYEFKNRVLEALMNSMFDIAFRKFTTAFEKRADKIYGRKNNSLLS